MPARCASGSSRSSAERSSASASGRRVDAPGARLEQSRRQADQARLAAAVGAGDLQRLARRSVRSRPSNSSRPPRPARRRSKRSRRHALLLERVHVGVAEPEMMADLVDQDVARPVLERVLALGPFVEHRAAEQADAVGQRARLLDARSVSGMPS